MASKKIRVANLQSLGLDPLLASQGSVEFTDEGLQFVATENPENYIPDPNLSQGNNFINTTRDSYTIGEGLPNNPNISSDSLIGIPRSSINNPSIDLSQGNNFINTTRDSDALNLNQNITRTTSQQGATLINVPSTFDFNLKGATNSAIFLNEMYNGLPA